MAEANPVCKISIEMKSAPRNLTFPMNKATGVIVQTSKVFTIQYQISIFSGKFSLETQKLYERKWIRRW